MEQMHESQMHKSSSTNHLLGPESQGMAKPRGMLLKAQVRGATFTRSCSLKSKVGFGNLANGLLKPAMPLSASLMAINRSAVPMRKRNERTRRNIQGFKVLDRLARFLFQVVLYALLGSRRFFSQVKLWPVPWLGGIVGLWQSW